MIEDDEKGDGEETKDKAENDIFDEGKGVSDCGVGVGFVIGGEEKKDFASN